MSIQSALVVDDSKVAHIKLRKMLEKRSISVDWVHSGEDAVSALDTQTPDIVFMDILMPGMDGFETTKTVLSKKKNAKLAIVMCSGNASDDDRQKAVAVGAAGFIGKPYTDKELERVIKDIEARTPAPAEKVEKPKKAAPVAAPAPEPTPTPAAVAVDIEAIVARATAAAQQAAEDSFKRLATELKQELAQIAAANGRDAAMEVAADTAATVAREASGEIARAAAEEVAYQQVQEAISAMPSQAPGLDAAAVTTALRHFASSDDFKRSVAAAAPPVAALDTNEIARVADSTARQVADQVAQKVAADASRSAGENARKIAEETARTSLAQAGGNDEQTRAAVKAGTSGLRMFSILLGAGLAAVIAYLVATAMKLL